MTLDFRPDAPGNPATAPEPSVPTDPTSELLAAAPAVVLPTAAISVHPMDPTLEATAQGVVAPDQARSAAPKDSVADGLEAPTATPVQGRKRRGRRPASMNTRGTILASARKLFTTHGYDRVSLRSIARDADVDPALLHHYFRGKPQLFLQAVAAVPADVSPTLQAVREAPREQAGRALVLNFLAQWDAPEFQQAFPAMVAFAGAEQNGGQPFQEFLQREILTQLPVQDPSPEQAQLRAQLVASTVLGLAMARYVVRLPKFVDATPEELADWIAPTLDRYLTGERA